MYFLAISGEEPLDTGETVLEHGALPGVARRSRSDGLGGLSGRLIPRRLRGEVEGATRAALLAPKNRKTNLCRRSNSTFVESLAIDQLFGSDFSG